jgi:putative DNA primase/helicase
MTQSFYGREDHDLTDRLLSELPGILGWAIEGWDRLRRRKHFSQPDSALELLGQLADLSSPIAAFIRDCCKVGPGYRVTTEEMFKEWQGWCHKNGRKEPGTVQSFGRDLSASIPTLRRVQGREGEERFRAYEGIGLVVDW